MKTSQQGTVIVYTGEGKGKTTAALGLALRARGQDFRVCVIQFLKSDRGRWGEIKTAEQIGIEWHQWGSGFTWQQKDPTAGQEKAVQGWKAARQKISSGKYDLIILDEFSYPLQLGWLDPAKVLRWLKEHRPEDLHLVFTGRRMPESVTAYADTVTEMKKIKHAFDQGIAGQRGIEF